MSAKHAWPGTRPALRLVHDSHDAVIRENREREREVVFLDNTPLARLLRAVGRILRSKR